MVLNMFVCIYVVVSMNNLIAKQNLATHVHTYNLTLFWGAVL